MYIKFIGLGAPAKAVLHYITDYITKSQLKTHVAYAALELSVQKLGEYDPQEDDISVHAKKLLQKCAYIMLTHQELSAQQVASYLMDYENHFTSHNFKSLYWISFEKCLDSMDPSPECTPSKDVQITVDHVNNEEPANKSCAENQEHATGTDSSENSIMHAPKEDDSSSDEEIDLPADECILFHLTNGSDSAVDKDEVVVSVNNAGELVARTLQVEDYLIMSTSTCIVKLCAVLLDG